MTVTPPPDVLLVSHTHWDREWYRTFEAFRARLIDTVDQVLDLLATNPGLKFVLDRQSIVVEDYLAVPPGRRAELEAVVRAGRLALGPWYVQPDSLLPAGESHATCANRRAEAALLGWAEPWTAPDGVIAVTVLRTFAWLARFQLGSRPVPAGPALPTPDGQMPNGISAHLSLRLDAPERVLQDDELGLRVVPAGDEPILAPDVSLLTLERASLVLTTMRAGDDGRIVVRVLNPTDSSTTAELSVGLPVDDVESLGLDETPDGSDVTRNGNSVHFTVGAHQLHTNTLLTSRY